MAARNILEKSLNLWISNPRPPFILQQKLRQFAQLGLLGSASFSFIAFYRGEPRFYSNVSLRNIQGERRIYERLRLML